MTSSGHCVFSPLNVREPPAGCRMRENVTRVQPRSIVTIKVQSVADTEGNFNTSFGVKNKGGTYQKSHPGNCN